MGGWEKSSLTFILTKLHIPTACVITQPGEIQQQKRREQANLAVPGRNRFGVVTIVEAVDAVLKFLAYQSLIFPAALGIGQPHPLTQVFGVIRGCFATVCCKICKKAQASATVVLRLNHKHGSQGQSEPPLQPQDRSQLAEKVKKDQKNAPLPGKSECPVADLLVFTAVFGERREGKFGVLAASRGSRADRFPLPHTPGPPTGIVLEIA